ncbi:MAG: hypothetical protein PHV59_05650 [Victivallales bacterium]|nr:hypothetical protein [Victivallales bacterium]
MKKKILTIILIVCFIFALDCRIYAADEPADKTSAQGVHVRNAGGFDRSRPNQFTASMKKLGRYLLMYIPNRLADATDIITLEANIGGGFSAELQLTRFFQFGGSYGESYFLAKAYARQYGGGHREINRFGFIFMEKDITFVNETFGSANEYVIDFPQFSTANYHLDAFNDNDVDFWKIGGNLGWIIGLGFGIHPVEIADFITGFFWIDLMGDDH